jgi:hypothetical protein
VRLRAHLAWLIKSPPTITGLRKRLDPLDDKQRSAIADFIVGVAGADGHITPEEIKLLGKVYPMLGLSREAVFGHVHAMAVSEQNQSDEPISVISASPTKSYQIPSGPNASQSIRLDMNAVSAKLADSAKISAILDDIFTEDDEPAATEAKADAHGKLTPMYESLLKRLVERAEWSRSEFEQLAAEAALMADGAIDTINEAGFEHIGNAVLEGEDPIIVDAAAKELLA